MQHSLHMFPVIKAKDVREYNDSFLHHVGEVGRAGMLRSVILELLLSGGSTFCCFEFRPHISLDGPEDPSDSSVRVMHLQESLKAIVNDLRKSSGKVPSTYCLIVVTAHESEDAPLHSLLRTKKDSGEMEMWHRSAAFLAENVPNIALPRIFPSKIMGISTLTHVSPSNVGKAT